MGTIHKHTQGHKHIHAPVMRPPSGCLLDSLSPKQQPTDRKTCRMTSPHTVRHPHTSKMSSVMPNYHPANQTMGAQLISSSSHLSMSHLFCGYLPLCWVTAFRIMWEDISLINLFPRVAIYLPHYCHWVYECPRLAFISSSQSQLCWICLIRLIGQVQASPAALPLFPAS